MRYKEKNKDCQLIVRAKTSFGETIDEKALSAFLRVNMRGFMKAKIVRKGVIEYTGPVGISLAARMKKLITKRDFFFILEHAVVAFQRIETKRLSMNNVVLDLHNVYINENTKEMQFLYVPSSKPKLNNDPLTFLENIIYSAQPASEKDMEYISRSIYFLRSMKGLDCKRLEKFIYSEDRSVVNTIKKQNVGDSDFITSKQRDYLDHYDNKKGDGGENTALLEDEEATGLLDENDSTLDMFGDEATGLLNEDDNTLDMFGGEATGLLDEDEDTGLLEEDEPTVSIFGDEATGLLDHAPTMNMYESEATGLLVDDYEDSHPQPMTGGVHFPSLKRVLTGEIISVNKPVFRLGKERSYVDYFVANNVAVSRSHADIISRGSRCFVMDLNSRNHTYINDQMLQVRVETEIRDGDTLRLGNEEFIFRK